MWKNVVEQGRPQVTIWCMRIACWIPKATNTHTQVTFPLQQWLHERTSLLRYTYIAYLLTMLPVFLRYLRRAYLQPKSLRIYF